MTNYNVNELTGRKLHHATADALDILRVDFGEDDSALLLIIRSHITAIAQHNVGGLWHADANVDTAKYRHCYYWDGCGDTLAEAVCRAILHAEVGPTVEIEEAV